MLEIEHLRSMREVQRARDKCSGSEIVRLRLLASLSAPWISSASFSPLSPSRSQSSFSYRRFFTNFRVWSIVLTTLTLVHKQMLIHICISSLVTQDYTFLLPSEATEVNGPSWQGLRKGRSMCEEGTSCEWWQLETPETWEHRLSRSRSSILRSYVTSEVTEWPQRLKSPRLSCHLAHGGLWKPMRHGNIDYWGQKGQIQSQKWPLRPLAAS